MQVIALGRAIERAYALGQRWEAWGRILDIVLDAARQGGDQLAEGWALHQLGTRAFGMGERGPARARLEEALALRVLIGDHAGATDTRHNLDVVTGRAPLAYRLSHTPLAVLAAVLALLIGAGSVAAARVLDSDPALVVAIDGRGEVVSDDGSLRCAVARCVTELAAGTEVVLQARPRRGREFAHWTGPCSGRGACRLVLKTDAKVGARFERVRHPRDLSVTVHGSGTVTSHPAGISCGTSARRCNATFTRSRRIELTAAAASAHRFTGWSDGVCTGTGRCVIDDDRARTVVHARFRADPAAVTLAIDLQGPGRGRVTSGQSGIDCGQKCAASFARGTRVTLTAVAQGGSRFAGWQDPACAPATRATCSVELDGSRTLAARFEPAGAKPPHTTHVLTVVVSGDGTVSSTPPKIKACAKLCSKPFTDGQLVVLTATEGPGWQFAGWDVARCGEALTCEITMNAERTVAADFEPRPPATHELTVVVSGEGTVSSDPPGIDCPETCTHAFDEGERVELTAVPGKRSERPIWRVAGCVEAMCAVTLDGPQRVEVRFPRRPRRPTTTKITEVDSETTYDCCWVTDDLQVSGRVSGGPAGSKVRLVYRPPGTNTEPFSEIVEVNAKRLFHGSFRPASGQEGNWTIRARYLGSRDYAPSLSQPFTQAVSSVD